MTFSGEALRAERHKAHRAFDALWISGLMSRSEAYQWMAKVMVLKKREAHIGKFNATQCRQLIKECRSFKNGTLP